MREHLIEPIGVSVLNSLNLSKISSLSLELMELISVYLCTVKWRSRSISISHCLGWKGYETSVRMDLCGFGDSSGVEKNFIAFPPPPSVEEVVL